ncbi:MAG: PAS domain S-box protein [Candidatus Celaenobacter antarcticus]|nr:PAS domain S-box protein [Candidatus Celaenobacter antarcticus]
MATKTNKFLVLFCSICLFIPLALSAVQNTSLLDSLMISGKENYESGRSDHAIFILLRAQELAENLQDIEQLQSIDRLLAEIYEEQGDYQSANIYLRKLQNIQDSLSLLQSGQILYYEDDETRLIRHQQYIEKFEIDKTNQLTLFFIILVVILIAAGLIIIKREKLSKNRMRRIIDEQTQSLKESNLQLEKEMKEKGINGEKFRTIFNSSTDSIFIHDLKDLSIIDVNDRSCELYGYTREEFKQLTIDDLSSTSMLSVDSPEAKLYLEKMLNGEVIFKEWEAKKKNGKKFWQDIQAKISLIDGEQRMLIFARDITERKKAAMKLKESQERYKQLIDNSPSLILEVDVETFKIISCNPAMAKSFGITVNKIIGNDIRKLLPGEIFKSRMAVVRKALEENNVIVFEDYNKGRFFYNTFIPLVLSNRKTFQIVSYDITERKHTEIALKEREALLQSMIFSIPLQFYAYGRDGKIFMQSERSLNKLGNLFGMRIDDLPIDESLKKLWNKWVNSAYAGNEVEGNFDIYINDELHHMKTIIAPIKKENEIIGVLGTDIDITEMKENEKKLLMTKDDLENMVRAEVEKRKTQQELLIQKSKLESLGQLAAGIAHEINQPIGLIALGLDNIYEKFKSGSDVSEKYLKEKIDKFFKYIERIHQIIDHIGTFSRDQKDITYDEVNINNVIEQALSMIGMQYGDHDIHFDTHLSENLPMILGNSFKIEQVLLNLLSNSHDALEAKMNDGIEFQKTITIKTFKKGKYIIVEFADNGIGMISREIERIFDPFYTTKEPEVGTGLGLSISYGILEEMKAEISVKSVQGEFTTFTIKFHSC